jgi:hypothetical protein
MTLTCGVGSPQIDRNSIGDLEAAKLEIATYAKENVAALKQVCETIDMPPDNLSANPGQAIFISKTLIHNHNSS